MLAAVETASATLESARRRIDDLNVFPVPDGDTGTNMARTVQALAAGLAALGPADATLQAATATRAALHGSPRQLRDHPVAGRARRRTRARARRSLRRSRRRTGSRRRASDAAYAAVTRARRGNDADGDPRDGARRRGGAETAARSVRSRPRSRRASGRSPARPSCCRDCARPASSTQGAPGSSSSCAGCSQASAASRRRPRFPTAELGPARRPRCDARRAVGLPLLHQLPRGGRGGRQGRAHGRAGGVRRQRARRRRSAGVQGARAHRRSRAARCASAPPQA